MPSTTTDLDTAAKVTLLPPCGAETASAGLIGGVVAGVAVLAALSFATYWYMRSKGSAAPEAPYAHEKNEIAYEAGKV